MAVELTFSAPLDELPGVYERKIDKLNKDIGK